MADDLAMPPRSLCSNPPINIDREPMLKIFAEAHLRRINVGPFAPPREEPVKLRLSFALRAVKGHVSRDALAAGRVPAEVEF